MAQQRDSVTIHNARQTQLEGRAMLAYTVNLGRARELRSNLVILGGTESRELPVSVPGRALAGALGGGIKVWDVPGGHASFAGREYVQAFAGRVLDVLRREGRLCSLTTTDGSGGRGRGSAKI